MMDLRMAKKKKQTPEERRAANRVASKRWALRRRGRRITEAEKAASREASRRSYARNPERAKIACYKWRAAHPDRRLTAVRNWSAHNKDKLAEHKLRYVAKKRAALDALKDVPCADCGQRYPPECMDFDHIRGAKVNSIGLMWLGQYDRMVAEIKKCEIVCSNCHRMRTRKRRIKKAAAKGAAAKKGKSR